MKFLPIPNSGYGPIIWKRQQLLLLPMSDRRWTHTHAFQIWPKIYHATKKKCIHKLCSWDFLRWEISETGRRRAHWSLTWGRLPSGRGAPSAPTPVHLSLQLLSNWTLQYLSPILTRYTGWLLNSSAWYIKHRYSAALNLVSQTNLNRRWTGNCNDF